MIAAWLKKWDTICPDIESLQREIQNDLCLKGKSATDVQILQAPEIHDYDRFYLPLLDEKLAYHSIPHQFLFKSFDGVVLCGYKMRYTYDNWLPNKNVPTELAPLPIPHLRLVKS